MVKTQEDCERLRALVGARRRADFAAAIELPGGPSMLSQHMSGNRPISLDAGVRYARGLNVPLDAISPRLAAEVRAAMTALDSPPPALSISEPPPRWAGASSDHDPLERLGAMLTAADPAMREAIAVNLAGWARAGGSGPWLTVLRGLLTAPQSKRRAVGE